MSIVHKGVKYIIPETHHVKFHMTLDTDIPTCYILSYLHGLTNLIDQERNIIINYIIFLKSIELNPSINDWCQLLIPTDLNNQILQDYIDEIIDIRPDLIDNSYIINKLWKGNILRAFETNQDNIIANLLETNCSYWCAQTVMLKYVQNVKPDNRFKERILESVMQKNFSSQVILHIKENLINSYLSYSNFINRMLKKHIIQIDEDYINFSTNNLESLTFPLSHYPELIGMRYYKYILLKAVEFKDDKVVKLLCEQKYFKSSDVFPYIRTHFIPDDEEEYADRIIWLDQFEKIDITEKNKFYILRFSCINECILNYILKTYKQDYTDLFNYLLPIVIQENLYTIYKSIVLYPEYNSSEKIDVLMHLAYSQYEDRRIVMDMIKSHKSRSSISFISLYKLACHDNNVKIVECFLPITEFDNLEDIILQDSHKVLKLLISNYPGILTHSTYKKCKLHNASMCLNLLQEKYPDKIDFNI